MTVTTLASVMTGARRLEVRELPIPPGDSASGLLFVEAAGVCGSDCGFYSRDLSLRVLGHENVGVIAEIGADAARRWGVSEGDRVALEEYLPCGHCSLCRTSEFRLCHASDPASGPAAIRYGSTPLETAPGLWGGYSQYLYLHPSAVLHRVDATVPAVRASLALPVANGYQWTYLDGGAGPGKAVLVMGPGQQGLACAMVAKHVGADPIIVTGLRRDAARLDMALRLGATATVCVEDEDLRERVRDITNGEMVDLVIDTAFGGDATLSPAVDLLRMRGTLVVPAATSGPLSQFQMRLVTQKYLTVKGVRGHSYESVEWALGTLRDRPDDLNQMCSLEVGLDEVDKAIRATAGELEDTPVIHAVVRPNG